MPRPAVLIAGAIAGLALLVGAFRFLSGVEAKASPEEFKRLTHDDLTINIEGDAFGLSKGDLPQASGRVVIENSTLTLLVDQSNTRMAAIGAEIECRVMAVNLLAVECGPTVTPFPPVWTAQLD